MELEALKKMAGKDPAIVFFDHFSGGKKQIVKLQVGNMSFLFISSLLRTSETISSLFLVLRENAQDDSWIPGGWIPKMMVDGKCISGFKHGHVWYLC